MGELWIFFYLKWYFFVKKVSFPAKTDVSTCIYGNYLTTGVRACIIYMLLRLCLHCSNLKTSCKFGNSQKSWPFLKTVLIHWIVPYWQLFLSYQDKRISNSFRIVSLDILILKKQQFSKLQKIDQSYTKVAIKVSNIKDMNINILCFFIHAFPHMFFIPKKTPKKWQFIYYLL